MTKVIQQPHGKIARKRFQHSVAYDPIQGKFGGAPKDWQYSFFGVTCINNVNNIIRTYIWIFTMFFNLFDRNIGSSKKLLNMVPKYPVASSNDFVSNHVSLETNINNFICNGCLLTINCFFTFTPHKK